MSMNSSELNPCRRLHSTVHHHHHHHWKRTKVRIHQLINRRRRWSKEAKAKARVQWKREMKMKNLKLYIENKSIIEENEKLREKALFLHQENRELISQLRMVFSSHNH